MRFVTLVVFSVMFICSCSSKSYYCVEQSTEKKCFTTTNDDFPFMPSKSSLFEESWLVKNCRLSDTAMCSRLISLDNISLPSKTDLYDLLNEAGDNRKKYFLDLNRNGYKTYIAYFNKSDSKETPRVGEFKITLQDYINALKQVSSVYPELSSTALLYFSLIGIIPDDNYAEKACRSNLNAECTVEELKNYENISVCHMLQKAYRQGKVLKKDYQKAHLMNMLPYTKAMIDDRELDTFSRCDMTSMYYEQNIPQNIKAEIREVFKDSNVKLTRKCLPIEEASVVDALENHPKTDENEAFREAVSAHVNQLMLEEYERKKASFDALPDRMKIDGKDCHKSYVGLFEYVCD